MIIHNWRKGVTVSEEVERGFYYDPNRRYFEASIRARVSTGEIIEMTRAGSTYLEAVSALEEALKDQGFVLL